MKTNKDVREIFNLMQEPQRGEYLEWLDLLEEKINEYDELIKYMIEELKSK